MRYASTSCIAPATSFAPWRVYNIGNANPVSVPEVVRILERELGRKAQCELVPMQLGDVPETVAARRERLDLAFELTDELGDGIKAANEECDLGANNSNTGTCTLACLKPKCGDGFKQVSVNEECDDGNASNTDACTAVCKNAKCGDTFVWSGKEQCDDGNVAGNDLCSPTCTKPKLVFITSGAWNGNLGGLGGGDGKCQTLANAAGLGGTFKAWLSNNTQNPQSRFVKSTTGYARVDGLDVAKTWADLVDGTILVPLNVNEKKAAVPQLDVWTGTNSNGTSLQEDCSGWTAPGGFGVIGYEGRNNATNGNWTNTGVFEASNCSTVQRLYCFQQ